MGAAYRTVYTVPVHVHVHDCTCTPCFGQSSQKRSTLYSTRGTDQADRHSESLSWASTHGVHEAAMADALPPLTPRSAAAQSQQGSVSPRRRRARRQQQQQMQEVYESPRRAVRESIGVATALPPPPKSFSAMYGRRTDWTEVTGLPCGDERSTTSVLSPRSEYSQSFSPRSSAFSIGSTPSSAVSTEQLWNQGLADRRNALLSKQEAHDRKVWPCLSPGIATLLPVQASNRVGWHSGSSRYSPTSSNKR